MNLILGRIRRRLAFLSAAVLTAACTVQPPAPAPTKASSPSPSRAPFNGKKTIHIGEDLDVRAGASGSKPYTGFDGAVADYLARRLGVRPVPVVVTPNDRERVLADDSVDLVVASYAFTPARARLVDFAGTYLVSDDGVLVRKENAANLNSKVDLPQKGKGVCTVANTIQSYDTQIHSHVQSSDEACLAEVISGKAFAYYSGGTIVARLAAAHPGLTAVHIPDLGSRSYTSVGIRKGSPDCSMIAGLLKDYLRDQWHSDFETHLPYLVRSDPNFEGDFRPSSDVVNRYIKCTTP